MVNNLKVIIAAAGTGSRMQSDINKQYMLLAGKPVLFYALNTFNQMDIVDEIIVVAHPEEVKYCGEHIVDKFALSKVTKVIPGGSHRQASVDAGLQALMPGATCVAIHDGARPLVTQELILNVWAAAKEYGAAIPAVASKDTLKTIDENGFVVKTLDRSSIIAVQTPQIFDFRQLCDAYELAKRDGYVGTDDASLYEKYIGKVKFVSGDNRNLKITTAEDLVVAERLAEMTK